MTLRLLVAIIDDATNRRIQDGDHVDIHGGSLGRVSGTVAARHFPSLPDDRGKMFLEIRMNRGTPAIGLDTASDIRVSNRGIFDAQILSAAVLTN